MRITGGWILSGVAAFFVLALLVVLTSIDNGSDDAQAAALPVVAPAAPARHVKHEPMVSDLWAGKPRNDAVDSGTAPAAHERAAARAQASRTPTTVSAPATPVTQVPAAVSVPAQPISTPTTQPAAAPVPAPKKAATKKKRKIKPSFKRGVLRTQDITIRITGYTVIPAGQGDNQYGEKPVIAFAYKATNVSGKKTSASSAFMFAFRAYQDTDPDVDNELDNELTFDGGSPDRVENIKKGRTVANVEAFALDDTTTAVKLIATRDLSVDDPIGKATYRLK